MHYEATISRTPVDRKYGCPPLTKADPQYVRIALTPDVDELPILPLDVVDSAIETVTVLELTPTWARR